MMNMQWTIYNTFSHQTCVITACESPFAYFELSRPRVNFGPQQKVDLQNFVSEGHPSVGGQSYP